MSLFFKSIINLIFTDVRLDVYLLPASFHTWEQHRRRKLSRDKLSERGRRYMKGSESEGETEQKPNLYKVNEHKVETDRGCYLKSCRSCRNVSVHLFCKFTIRV